MSHRKSLTISFKLAHITKAFVPSAGAVAKLYAATLNKHFDHEVVLSSTILTPAGWRQM